MPARVARLRRGTTAAALSTAIALAFHVHAGGGMPGPLGVAIPLILTSLVGMLAGGARPNLAGLLATTTTAQLLFHTLFAFDSPGSGAGAHAHGAAVTSLGSSAAVGDAWMGQMHVAAAVVTAVLLHRAELVLGWLRRTVQVLAGTLVPAQPVASPVPIERSSRRVAPAAEPVAWMLRDLLTRAPRRGPPALLGT